MSSAAPAQHQFVRTTLFALALVVLLATMRSVTGWDDLAARRLPDTDDLMRLIQLRDLLGGQAWADLAQHRLGAPPGTAMHWTRIADLAPLAILAIATPVLGASGAELAALILWPSLLLLGFVLLAGSLAARLAARDAVIPAMLVAALAWPATWQFVPGRIDHHGLQIVLLLAALRGALGNRPRAAALVGAAAATSLAIGVETAPLLAILLGWAALRWLRDPASHRASLATLAASLALTSGALALVAPIEWDARTCDGFTRPVGSALLVAAPALGMLAALPATVSPRTRLAAIFGIAVLSLIALVVLAPACLADPYAAVDPAARAGWLGAVGEARGLFALAPATALAYAAIPFLGTGAALLLAIRRRGDWTLLLFLLAAACLLGLHQSRALSTAAALAPPALAAIIAVTRRRHPALAPLAWAASLGISWQLAAMLLPADPVSGCVAGAALGRLAAQPPGTVLAPIDLGPRILADTDHRVIAAPYHRAGAGIALALAAERDPAGAFARSGADYLLACPPGGTARLVSAR